jgi:hypothetical protein
MDPPDRDFPEVSTMDGGRPGPEPPHAQEQPPDDGFATDWLEEIVARLEEPDEWGPAFESLSELDEEVRDQVLAMLASYRDREGVHHLINRFHPVGDDHVREFQFGNVIEDPGGPPLVAPESEMPAQPVAPFSVEVSPIPTLLPTGWTERGLSVWPVLTTARIVRSLVTALDGEGLGTIMISTSHSGDRRTVAFRCDVRRGIMDAVGQLEDEQPSAGRLIDEWIRQAETDYVMDVPEVAIRLLRAALLMSGPEISDRVRSWIDVTIGPRLSADGSAMVLPGSESDGLPAHRMAAWVGLVLDACPRWLDRSSLTYELAEELAMREGGLTPDPIRDAGAYRYLFEHRLIRRLQLYARMLFWMGWVWQAAGRIDLSRSAFALAAELSDEQNAVPSHPFTVILTTRSLRAAQAELLASARSRSPD